MCPAQDESGQREVRGAGGGMREETENSPEEEVGARGGQERLGALEGLRGGGTVPCLPKAVQGWGSFYLSM